MNLTFIRGCELDIDMLALVTGAGGFMGPYLCEELLKAGHHVRAMVRRRFDNFIPMELLELEKMYGEKISVIPGDVLNMYDVLTAISMTNWVFHLAAQSFVPSAIQNPSYTTEVNTRGIQNVLDAVKLFHSQRQRVVFASSSQVNFSRPQNPYATCKMFGEHLCQNYGDEFGVDFVITRAFNHEGARRGHQFVTAHIIRQLVMVKMGETDKLYIGDVTSKRDWSHVKDVARAYTLIAEKGKTGEIYVIGSGNVFTIQEFIEKVAKFLNIEGEFEIVSQSQRKRSNDYPNVDHIISNDVRNLGWAPKFGIYDIIQDMTDFYFQMSKDLRMSIRS